MSFKKELFRKLTATLLVMGLLAVMLYFSIILVSSSDMFDPLLKTVLTVCTITLCLAALYFFYCKIYETVMLIKSAKTFSETQKKSSAPKLDTAEIHEDLRGAFHEEEFDDDEEIEDDDIDGIDEDNANAEQHSGKDKVFPGKK